LQTSDHDLSHNEGKQNLAALSAMDGLNMSCIHPDCRIIPYFYFDVNMSGNVRLFSDFRDVVVEIAFTTQQVQQPCVF